MKKPLLIFVVFAVLLASCSSAAVERATDFGSPKLAVSRSGGCIVQADISKGRVEDVVEGDGWYYTDMRGSALVQIGGDVFLTDATQNQIDTYMGAFNSTAATAALIDLIQQDGTVPFQPAACTPVPQ